ncbi:MAG: beta strand repeat-containing protein [Flavobacterium psychrophilum]
MKFILSLILLISTITNAQVKVGDNTTSMDASAMLELESTTKGFLPPRMTKLQINAIANPEAGLQVWCINCGTEGEWQVYTGSTWTNIIGGTASIETITGLNCSLASNNGTLTSGTAANSVNTVVPYTAGYGYTHNGQTVTSSGVTGLTAALASGTFANGSGSLTYTITGTPESAGTATFALNIGGQTCNLSRTVILPVGIISGLTCSSATPNGALITGTEADAVYSAVPYSGGNGGTHNGQTVTSTGVTGLTTSLSSGTFASGSGTLTYTITGTPASAGTATFALNIGGQTCNLSRTVILPIGTITGLTCDSATNNGTLTFGTAASSVNSVVPYTGGNGGTHNGQTVTSTGVTGLTATLSAGTFASGSGSLTYAITGTPSSGGTATFALNIGEQTCNLSRTVLLPVGTITGLSCGSATHNGALSTGTAASGVNSVITYTGGNGGTHNGQTVTSTGVTGLTATLSAGTFASGTGTLTYAITGTPTSNGTATFALNIGGQTCNLTRTVCGSTSVTFTYMGESVTYGVVVSLGKCWLDRNLGATQVATSSTDTASYGDLFQWGRGADGHQLRNSGVTIGQSSSTTPGTNFLSSEAGNWNNWYTSANYTSLWQGVSGTNNPCPSGYRLPTSTEWQTEYLAWGSQNPASSAFNSQLKLPAAGYRTWDGSLYPGSGKYWTGTYTTDSFGQNSNQSRMIEFNTGNSFIAAKPRIEGNSVRCISN